MSGTIKVPEARASGACVRKPPIAPTVRLREEAAAICESAVGTIKSRVNRARTRLSKLLSIDSADRFSQDHTTRAVPTVGGRG